MCFHFSFPFPTYFFFSVFRQVAALKFELKLRSLPVSGTKNDLIERLRTYQEQKGGIDTTLCPTAGGITGSGAEGAGRSPPTAAAGVSNTSLRQYQLSSLTGQSEG